MIFFFSANLYILLCIANDVWDCETVSPICASLHFEILIMSYTHANITFFSFFEWGKRGVGIESNTSIFGVFLHMDIHHYDASKCYKQLCFSCVKYKIENWRQPNIRNEMGANIVLSGLAQCSPTKCEAHKKEWFGCVWFHFQHLVNMKYQILSGWNYICSLKDQIFN